ncbi:MAG TPA: hypothetical protein VHY91_19570 [Pirellulales bacterium]|jgi:hypothetical protein|nr:hypothetical protein [Pirellulales bacterium]
MATIPHRRDQFLSRVADLFQQVKEWAEPHGWTTRPYPKKMRDVDQKVYETSALFLSKGPTRLLLDPVTYDVPGAEGVVDLALMPTYDDAASLYFEDGAWVIHYAFPADSGKRRSAKEAARLSLSETTINQVLDAIVAHDIQPF